MATTTKQKNKVGRPPHAPGRVTYVRVPEPVREILVKMSRDQDKPLAALIRAALREYVERSAAAA